MGYAKFVFAFVLLAYVLVRVDWGQAGAYVKQVEFGWMLLFLTTYPLMSALMARRWQVLLFAQGYRPSFWRLFGLCVVGQFYNLIFPSTVGGDVARAVGLRKAIGATKPAMVSTLVERLTGAAFLGLLGMAALALSWNSFWGFEESTLGFEPVAGLTEGRVVILMALGSMLMIAGVITATLSHGLTSWGQRRMGAGLLSRVFAKIVTFQEAVSAYRKHPRALMGAMWYAALYQISGGLTIFLACRMLGEPVPLIGVLIATPIIFLIGVLPLTPGGYGVVQWGYMVCFSALALTSAETAATLGVLASLLVTIRGIVFSSIGFVLYNALDLWYDRKSGATHPPTGLGHFSH